MPRLLLFAITLLLSNSIFAQKETVTKKTYELKKFLGIKISKRLIEVETNKFINKQIVFKTTENLFSEDKSKVKFSSLVEYVYNSHALLSQELNYFSGTNKEMVLAYKVDFTYSPKLKLIEKVSISSDSNIINRTSYLYENERIKEEKSGNILIMHGYNDKNCHVETKLYGGEKLIDEKTTCYLDNGMSKISDVRIILANSLDVNYLAKYEWTENQNTIISKTETDNRPPTENIKTKYFYDSNSKLKKEVKTTFRSKKKQYFVTEYEYKS